MLPTTHQPVWAGLFVRVHAPEAIPTWAPGLGPPNGSWAPELIGHHVGPVARDSQACGHNDAIAAK